MSTPQVLPFPFNLEENPDSRQMLAVWLHQGKCLVSCFSLQMDDPSKAWGFTLTAIAQAVAASEAIELKGDKEEILKNIIAEFVVFMQDKMEINPIKHPTQEQIQEQVDAT